MIQLRLERTSIMHSYFVILVTTVCFLYYYFTRTFNYWKDRNVKGPTPIPFFGNFIDVFFRRKHVGVLYSELYKQYPNEKVVGLYRMMSPTLLIRDLDMAKQILIKDSDSFPDRGLNFSRQRLGDNLFHASVEVAKVLRKPLSSVLTASKFKANFQMLADRADKFIEFIERATAKESELDVLPLCRRYGVDSITMNAFGIDVDPYNEENNLCDVMDARIQKTSFFLELELLFSGTLKKFNLSIFSDKVDQFCKQILQAGIDSENVAKTDRNRTMDVLMGLRREGMISSPKKSEDDKELWLKITDDVLAGQVLIFYAAGYANISLLLSFTMFHLAKNPDVQEKMIQEIDEILQNHDGEFTYEILKEMKYVQMVFDETLRMHPLANSVARNVARDIKLDGTDYVIHKDVVVAISAHSIQNDEKYYPEPEKFRPERFSPENAKERHPCTMMSFGLGPRSCLGSRFAQLQFGICMVKVFSNYRVECTENTVDTFTYTARRLLMTPNEKTVLRLVRREK